MEHGQKLEAPNDEELRRVEQLEDRSGLSTLYFTPGEQYDGKILTAEERLKTKEEHIASISNSIWKSFLRIGLYIPYPFVIGASIAAGFYTLAKELNPNPLILLGLAIVAVGLWGLTSYFAYASIFKIFYKHALRAGPFVIVMLISVLLAAQAAYGLVATMFYQAELPLLFNVTVVSILVIIYSIIVSGILLAVWGNAKVKSVVKLAVSLLVIAVSGFSIAAVYNFL